MLEWSVAVSFSVLQDTGSIVGARECEKHKNVIVQIFFEPSTPGNKFRMCSLCKILKSVQKYPKIVSTKYQKLAEYMGNNWQVINRDKT